MHQSVLVNRMKNEIDKQVNLYVEVYRKEKKIAKNLLGPALLNELNAISALNLSIKTYHTIT